MRKHDFVFIKKYSEEKGYLLLSKEYENQYKLMDVVFSCGHKGKRNFRDIKRRTSVCSKCSKSIKYEYDEITEKLFSIGFILMDKEYFGANEKMNIMDSEGYKYFFTFHNIMGKKKNSSSFRFDVGNIYALENIKIWISKNKNWKVLSEKYFGAHKNKLYLECLECDTKWNACWSNIYSNETGCPTCQQKHKGEILQKRNVTEEKNLKIDAPFLMEEWDYEKNAKNPEEYSYRSNIKVHWICSSCGEKWIATIGTRTVGRGCPFCAQSGGEKKIRYFLKDNNLEFKPEFSFDDLLSDLGNPLRFDFSVFQNGNILRLIEFDGGQHTRYIPFIHKTIENFHASQKRDKMKDDYCKEHGIPLLRIPDTEFKNIESILSKELNLIKKEDS